MHLQRVLDRLDRLVANLAITLKRAASLAKAIADLIQLFW